MMKWNRIANESYEKCYSLISDWLNDMGNNILKRENKCSLSFVIKAELEMAETNSKG